MANQKRNVEALNTVSPPRPESRLTFGLELEFAIAVVPPGGCDPHPKDPRTATDLVTGPYDTWLDSLKERVAATLCKVNLKALARSPYAEDNPTESLGSWIVKHDDTIKAPAVDGYIFLPIEITSPAYWYTDLALGEVKLVCQELVNHYRITTNRSCGVHVHVGKGNKGFTFEDIQNLLATLWTFEPQIETMHPKHRVENTTMCPSFRRYSELTRSNTTKGVLDVRGGLDEILRHGDKIFQSLEDLAMPRTGDSYQGGSRLAYHLGDVGAQLPQSDNYRRTIEFRQHKGTVIYEELEPWIKFCLGLVLFADSIEQSKLATFLRANIGRSVEEMPLELVLRKLDMADLAVYYPEKIMKDRLAAENEVEVPLYHLRLG
ncbi:hypothetical protein WAI453_004237 [Rhynchosporium graminicola]|uniref:Amidoligase enzyme n=1 Tax=Rhynchosporium graminicola TaxID=2792576 RepID=A0A1E1K1A0_9HELO|nr:uncharacterized protein RCO7_08598 [Rhynchosporium commune]